MSPARAVGTPREQLGMRVEVDATTWGGLKRSPILADLENSGFDLKTIFLQ